MAQGFVLTFPRVRVAKVATRAVRKAKEIVAQRETQKLKRSLSTPYPPASSAFAKPHRRTGRLQRGAKYQVDSRGNFQLVTKVVYGKFLQKGTRKMAPRHIVNAKDVTRIGKLIQRLAKAAVPDKRATRGFRIPRGAVKGLG